MAQFQNVPGASQAAFDALNTNINHELYSDEGIAGKYNGVTLYRRIFSSSSINVAKDTATQMMTGLPLPSKIICLSVSYSINNNNIYEDTDMYIRSYVDSEGKLIITQSIGNSVAMIARAEVLYVK